MGVTFFRGLALKKAIGYSIFTLGRLLCLGIAKVAFRLHVGGQEFIPRTGPAILAANHVSYIDPIIIGIAIRRPVRFMAKKELFRFPLFGWLLRQFGAFPVNRARTNLQTFKQAISLLKAGEIVAIFPEGTRGDGVDLRPAKPGIGLIAARTGAPVIPVFHRGTEKVFPKGAWLPRPYRITMNFGAPCRFVEEQAGKEQGQVMIFSRTIMEKIAALKTWSESGSRSGDDRTYATGEAMPTKKRGINERT
ncbi:MAG: 1-acyl-sn-glycerol-3-phosphate acyltransferase [candidate division NC10 bacterium]|nr:1-acyl-sn-glycerol-3-phosphate acyltransferase [candidate division NC10 bacterium]MDE2322151.1 1-acyl-sn-glycerol-3-phosphate acyltransferase [candidate division NC10 bacterium]